MFHICILICWTASASWFIPLSDTDDKTDQLLKEIDKRFDVIDDDLQQRYCRQNAVASHGDDGLSDDDNKENFSEHTMSNARSSESTSLQVSH